MKAKAKGSKKARREPRTTKAVPPIDATATYLAAEIPRQFTILGQRLLPFSLWHMEVLLRLGNGFVTPAEKITEGDLIQGVFFCCQTWEQGLNALTDPELNQKLLEWGSSVGEEIAKKAPGKFLKTGPDLEEKALAFAGYILEGSGRPELLPADGSDSRTPGAPLLQMLRMFLVQEMRLTVKDAMNYPFALACHDFFAFHEQRGAAKIANSEEAAALAEHEEHAGSDEALRACLEALPGAVPVNEEDRAKVRAWKKAKRKAKKGKRCRSN